MGDKEGFASIDPHITNPETKSRIHFKGGRAALRQELADRYEGVRTHAAQLGGVAFNEGQDKDLGYDDPQVTEPVQPADPNEQG